jgi:beta-glucosidase
MKQVLVIASFFLADFAFSQDAKMDLFLESLMRKMTLDEKIGQLNLVVPGRGLAPDAIVSKDVEQKIMQGQIGGLLNLVGEAKIRQVQELAITKSRLKIPLLFGLDVIHGYKTTFPIPLALSCSWDIKLIEQSARLAAIEATADGLNWAFSPMVDIARDPRWGRIAEGAGEDPYLGSQVAKAMVTGYQGSNPGKENTLMACVKHFALYGAAEGGLDYNTVDMSRERMYNEYLPPYKAAIDAGAGSVMTAFNTVNYIPATGNKWLLSDLLRKQWGFKGFVVSDYTSINEMIVHGMGDLQAASALALQAGLDMDMMGGGFLTTLKKSLQEKKITQKQIDDACRRILEAKYKLGLFADPYRYCNAERAKQEILSETNRKAAREFAKHSFVLLKNSKQVLPLKKSGTIALIGPLANDKINVLGTWAVSGYSDLAIPVLEGMKTRAGKNVNLLYAKGANISDDTVFAKNVNTPEVRIEMDKRSPQQMIDEAITVANQSDLIVAVIGEASEMSGESSSRSDIDLPSCQLRLLKALKSTGKPLVLIVMSGRPLTLNWENANADAILFAWHGGHETGNAIADVLWGEYNPSGKLTTTFPRNVGQIPIYYNHLNTGKPGRGDKFEKWRANYLDVESSPLYPFGYGLSYTSFSYSDIKLSDSTITARGKITATLAVTNTGGYDGGEVVQMYIRDLAGSIARPVKELKGFEKIFLKKGESKEISFTININDLKFYNNDFKYVAEPGDFKLFIGSNSRDVKEANFKLLM